jgi:hypothetical protein
MCVIDLNLYVIYHICGICFIKFIIFHHMFANLKYITPRLYNSYWSTKCYILQHMSFERPEKEPKCCKILFMLYILHHLIEML